MTREKKRRQSMKKSIVTEYEDISAFSGSPAQCKHHLIMGRGLRELADADGLFIPLTHAEHNMSAYGNQYQVHKNAAAEKLSKIAGQLAYEENYLAEILAKGQPQIQQTARDWRLEAREAFRKRYGQSFL